MNRVLLAFLALLGLVAQAAPAEARACPVVTEIGIVAQARVASRALAARAATISRPVLQVENLSRIRADAFPAMAPQAAVLAVRIGIDRSAQ